MPVLRPLLRRVSRLWARPKCDPIAPGEAKASDDLMAPSREQENKAVRVRGDENVTPGDTKVQDDVAAAIRALAAEDTAGGAALERLGARVQRALGTLDEKVVKVQIFNFGRTYADRIFADCSSSKNPPQFVYNEQEKCLEAELELIYDKSSGQYWCGWGMFFLEDAKKEIELRMGEVKITTSEGVDYRHLIVKDGRSRFPRW